VVEVTVLKLRKNKSKGKNGGAPIMVSDAFIKFMYMRTELSDFVRHYHTMAAKAVGDDESAYDKDLYDSYRGQAFFFLENYISRISDFFDLYLEHLIYAIVLEKRDFLPEKSYEKAFDRLKNIGLAEVTAEDVLFEAALNLGRKDKIEIAKHFNQSLNFDITNPPQLWGDALLCSKIRNLIVHRSSVMDERFVMFAKDKNCPFEVGIGKTLVMPEKWILQIASNVDELIFTIDDGISDFVAIHKRNRLGHTWLPRSNLAKPLNEDEI
jgi:hypothetical protein